MGCTSSRCGYVNMAAGHIYGHNSEPRGKDGLEVEALQPPHRKWEMCELYGRAGQFTDEKGADGTLFYVLHMGCEGAAAPSGVPPFTPATRAQTPHGFGRYSTLRGELRMYLGRTAAPRPPCS